MARNFVNSGSQYMDSTLTSLPYPYTAHCHFRVADIAIDHTFFGVGGGATNLIGINGYGNPVVRSEPGGLVSGDATVVSTNTWYRMGGTFGQADKQVFFNGVSSTAASTDWGPQSVVTVAVGARIDGAGTPTSGFYQTGDIAEVGFWNVILTADEMAALGAGLCPLLIRPKALISYWPLLGRSTTEEDWVGGNTLTNHSSTVVDHSRVFRPQSRPRRLGASAGGGGGGGSLAGSRVGGFTEGGLVNSGLAG